MENTATFDQSVGQTREISLPTPGMKYTIREMNGEDEDTLTLMRDAKTGDAINKFLSRIITSATVTPADIHQWRVRDKYYLLFEAVRLSYGDTLKFKHEFEDGVAGEFEEDLAQFAWDFDPANKEAYPVQGTKGYFEQRIQAYPSAKKDVEFKLESSGIRVGFQFLCGELEEAMLQVDENESSINDELRARNFFVMDEHGAKKVIENFRSFKVREMREIRVKLQELDLEWGAVITMPHPSGNSAKDEMMPVFKLPDFFFPRLM